MFLSLIKEDLMNNTRKKMKVNKEKAKSNRLWIVEILKNSEKPLTSLEIKSKIEKKNVPKRLTIQAQLTNFTKWSPLLAEAGERLCSVSGEVWMTYKISPLIDKSTLTESVINSYFDAFDEKYDRMKEIREFFDRALFKAFESQDDTEAKEKSIEFGCKMIRKKLLREIGIDPKKNQDLIDNNPFTKYDGDEDGE